jgi:putative cardiolipin synthase
MRTVLLLAGGLLAACSQLPPLAGRSESAALQDTQDTRLGAAVQALVRDHPGLSGVVPLVAGHDAFAARVALAQAAQRSLDIQYYIWRRDLTGSLLMDAVRAAARRGVRVRLLLDDNNTPRLDAWLRALDAEPNVEVRLFNPFPHRGLRVLDYLGDFARVNRRMHNKTFTADNQVTLVGGRNVGDAYFAAGADLLFVDLDVLAIGSVVPEVSRDFDRYWASASAYPLAALLPALPPAGDPAPVDAAAGDAYREEVARSPFVRDLLARQLPFRWGPVRMISDDPAKVLGRAGPGELLWTQLLRLAPTPAHEVILVSPYFVPGERGTALLAGLARSGVQVSVLTNALEATDVPAVHAGYARWRPQLLAAGVRLYELKAGSAPAPMHDARITGSSSSSLHAKVFVLDRARLFVGSFNFDPRSVRLNTELGFLIENAPLATEFAQQFDALVGTRAYRVERVDGGLRWSTLQDGQVARFDSDPHAGPWRRLVVRFLALLPIDGLL